MTRIFTKPQIKGKGESNASIGERNTPIPSRFMKKPESVKDSPRTKYLQELEEKIFQAEKKLENTESLFSESTKTLQDEFSRKKWETESAIYALESILILKREERVQLEAPFIDRTHSLDAREKQLSLRSEFLDGEEQKVFERERACQSTLEGVQDLSDSIGEMRVRLTVREKLLDGKERLLKDRETQHLIKVKNLEEQAKQIASQIENRAEAVKLQELNIESKEENLAKREKELLNGHIQLNDQRGTLARAWKEIERKKNG